jgi:hypothetical protein
MLGNKSKAKQVEEKDDQHEDKSEVFAYQTVKKFLILILPLLHQFFLDRLLHLG